MYNKTLSCNNNEVAEVVIKLDSDSLEKSLYYRDEGNVSKGSNLQATGCNYFQFTNDTVFQMNIVVSLFAQEQEEKRVIRFKKIAVDDTNSEFIICHIF